MRIVVTGAGGRLDTAMVAGLTSAGHEVLTFDIDGLDISHERQAKMVIKRAGPDVIVNCSAYNAVDAAENDAATAFRVNTEGPSYLAAASEATGAVFVHYSTDFVFDGRSQRPYFEDDATHPLSLYGASKLAGEHEARRAERHYILRLASLFGGGGLNGHQATVDRLTASLLLGVPVRAQADRTVSPSYVPDVVRATRELLHRKAPFGTYHCVTSGWTTWYHLATELTRHLGSCACVIPIDTDYAPGAAPRPRFCALSNEKLVATVIDMRSWRSALNRHVAEHREQTPAKTSAAETP